MAALRDVDRAIQLGGAKELYLGHEARRKGQLPLDLSHKLFIREDGRT